MNIERRSLLRGALGALVLTACGGSTTSASPQARDTSSKGKPMTEHVLLIGKIPFAVEDVKNQLQMPDVEVHIGTGLDDVRAAFARTKIDHVVMGAGVDLDVRLAIVREVLSNSETTTIHLKDHASGREGFIPFVRAVLIGLHTLR